MAAAGKFVGGGAEAEAVLRALRDAPSRHAGHDVSGEARDGPREGAAPGRARGKPDAPGGGGEGG